MLWGREYYYLYYLFLVDSNTCSMLIIKLRCLLRDGWEKDFFRCAAKSSHRICEWKKVKIQGICSCKSVEVDEQGVLWRGSAVEKYLKDLDTCEKVYKLHDKTKKLVERYRNFKKTDKKTLTLTKNWKNHWNIEIISTYF